MSVNVFAHMQTASLRQPARQIQLKKKNVSNYIEFNCFVAHTSVRICVHQITVPECIRHTFASTNGSSVISENSQITLNIFQLEMITVRAVLTYVV